MKKYFFYLLSIVLLMTFGLVGCDKKPENKEPIFTLSQTTLTDGSIANRITGLTEYGQTLQDITIPATIDDIPVVEIASNAFKNQVNLFTVSFDRGSQVKKIGNNAFENCRSLNDIKLPNSINFVGDDAFSNCIKLTNITLSKNLVDLGAYAFAACTSLESITLPSTLSTINEFTFTGCLKLTSVTFSEGSIVSEIGERAFSGCSTLSSVMLPNSVTKIGAKAFRDCTNLVSINIPENVTLIGERAFENCINLSIVTFLLHEDWSTSGLLVSSEIVAQPTLVAQYLSALYCETEWTINNLENEA